MGNLLLRQNTATHYISKIFEAKATDEIIRAVSKDGFVKISVVTARDAVQRANAIHHCSPTAIAALGRSLCAASMLGDLLKEENGTLTLRISGGGGLGSIIAVSDSEGNVRGMVSNPAFDLPTRPDGKLDVGGAVGKDGMLTVSRDIGLREPYIGSTELVSGEIAEDITNYYAVSEQIPTVCALGVLVDPNTNGVLLAGGLLIQVLPGALPQDIEKLEANIATLEPVTTMLAKGMTVEQMVDTALTGFEVEKLEEIPVHYACTCSREKYYNALATLEPDEIDTLPAVDGKVEAVCPYCCRKYYFTKEELHELAESVREKRKNASK